MLRLVLLLTSEEFKISFNFLWDMQPANQVNQVGVTSELSRGVRKSPEVIPARTLAPKKLFIYDVTTIINVSYVLAWNLRKLKKSLFMARDETVMSSFTLMI